MNDKTIAIELRGENQLTTKKLDEAIENLLKAARRLGMLEAADIAEVQIGADRHEIADAIRKRVDEIEEEK